MAIIGIVAAMTIPTLVFNYKSKAWNTAATVFETKIEAALKVMNTQQTLAGYTNTKDFLNEFSKHIKITRICDTVTDCMEEKVSWGDEEVEISKIKTSKNFGQNDWNTDVLGVQFANGTVGAIAYNPTCKQNPYTNQITASNCIALLYDTSGMQSPNARGKDLRGIQINKLGSNCAFEVGGVCYGSPFVPSAVSLDECEQMKSRGEVQGCYYDNDYWAGAVKQCGGKRNMPTYAQLARIATEVYGVPIGSGQTKASRNDLKMSSYGFNIRQLDSMSSRVWVGEGEHYAPDRYNMMVFEPNYYGPGSGNRSYPFYAVCVMK